MNLYKFRVPREGNPALLFDCMSPDEGGAVDRARQRLAEQEANGKLPVSLDYGLLGGQLELAPEQITTDCIVGCIEDSMDF